MYAQILRQPLEDKALAWFFNLRIGDTVFDSGDFQSGLGLSEYQVHLLQSTNIFHFQLQEGLTLADDKDLMVNKEKVNFLWWHCYRYLCTNLAPNLDHYLKLSDKRKLKKGTFICSIYVYLM